MQFYEYKLHTVSHLSTNFDSSKHCGGGNLMFLICHMSSRNNVFKGLCHFMVGSSLR